MLISETRILALVQLITFFALVTGEPNTSGKLVD